MLWFRPQKSAQILSSSCWTLSKNRSKFIWRLKHVSTRSRNPKWNLTLLWWEKTYVSFYRLTETWVYRFFRKWSASLWKFQNRSYFLQNVWFGGIKRKIRTTWTRRPFCKLRKKFLTLEPSTKPETKKPEEIQQLIRSMKKCLAITKNWTETQRKKIIFCRKNKLTIQKATINSLPL